MRIILTFLLVLVGACSGRDSPAAPPRVQAILITPQLATLTSEGATQQFSARPVDQDGGSVVGVTVTWRSSDPSVVQVDPTIGLATAVSEGNAIVIAESGTVSGQASVAVEIIECTEPFEVTLVPGQTLVTEPPASATCALRLPAGNPGDRYRVAVVSLRTAQNTPVVTASLTLTPQGAVSATAARLRTPAPPPLLNAQQMALLEASARVAEATARVHERLRASEEEMLRRLGPSAMTRFPIAFAPAGPFLVSPARKTFIASSDGKCSLEGKTPVTGLLVAQSATIAVYQDSVQQAQFQGVSVGNVQRILDFFTAHGKSTIESYFGAIPDRDKNDQVMVLVTPAVSGNVAAFVWGGDQLDASDCAASNQMELVYFSATHINDISKGNYQALETLVHEVKHVVSFNQRISGGGLFNTHPTWMEEGTAEIASEIASRKAWAAVGGPPQNGVVTRESFPASGTPTTPENYGVYLRLRRSQQYLSTQPNSLMNAPANETFFIYGSGWHFHRFLGDSYGAASSGLDADAPLFSEQNSSGNPPGLPGLLTLTGKPIEALLPEYVAAAMLNGSEAPPPPMGFTTYDFPSAITVLPGNFGPYPYPVTGTASDPSVSFATGGTWSGPLGNAGLRIHDFLSNGTGVGADVTAQVEGPAKLVVVRLR